MVAVVVAVLWWLWLLFYGFCCFTVVVVVVVVVFDLYVQIVRCLVYVSLEKKIKKNCLNSQY